MLKRIHEKLGTAGLVIAVVALVVALGGTAFAAAGLNSKQKKEVKKIAKQFAGKQGPKGDPGSAGAQGAKGDQGPKGDQGSKGDEGNQGPKGDEGPAGPTETELPEGKTMTGTFALRDSGLSWYWVNVSFPLRVVPAPELSTSDDTTHCKGTPASPQPAAGYFCVYPTQENNAFIGFIESPDSTSGVNIEFPAVEASEPINVVGTWAVRERCPIDPETELELESC